MRRGFRYDRLTFSENTILIVPDCTDVIFDYTGTPSGFY